MSPIVPVLLALVVGWTTTPDLFAWLRSAGLSDNDLRALERGEVVGNVLERSGSSELALLGAARTAAAPAALAARYRGVEGVAASESVLAAGRISDPPALSDFAGLSLEPEDVDALRECEVGACGVKLSASMIRAFRTRIDWSRPDAEARANDLYRQLLLQYARDYLERGGQALLVYGDKPAPASVADGLARLAAEPPLGYGVTARGREWLVNGSARDLPGSTTSLFWSKQRFGPLKPVVTLTHVAVFEPDPGRVLVVMKEIYASHYVETGIGSTTLVRIGESPEAVLVYLHRIESDALGGWLGLKRQMVEKQVAHRFREHIERARSSLATRSSPPTAGGH